ncbi:MAG: hypothetical protein M0Q91_12240, partial [Methanoregula sp.]|nr:hypothetical protein [Methanoregula sp.]
VYATGANTATRLPIGTVAQVLTVNAGATAPEWAAPASGGIGENILINGDFVISQRGTTFTSASSANNDDVYIFDRWNLLSDGNDIVDCSQVGGSSANALGSRAFAKFDIETEDKKWGIIQIIEFQNSAQLIGGSCSLSFKAARGVSDTSTLLRAGVLSWVGTADTVTSDVVNAWGAEGSNPTLVSGWTFENTPVALAELTDAWQTFEIENIAIDTANASNVAVFIWSDDMTNAVGDLVYITDVKLEKGTTCTDFIPRSMAQENLLCQRYFEKIGGAQRQDFEVAAYHAAGSNYGFTFCYVQKRVIPIGTVVGTWTVGNCGQPVIAMTGLNSAYLRTTVTATGAFYFLTEDTSNYLTFNAEL